MQLYAEPTQLAAQVSALLADAASPSAALQQLALRCLQTGHPEQAAHLRRSGLFSNNQLAELQALSAIDLLSLYSSWKAAAITGWQAALAPDALLRLGLLLSRSEGLLLSRSEAGARARLRSDLPEGSGRGWCRPIGPRPWRCGICSAAAAPTGAGRG